MSILKKAMMTAAVGALIAPLAATAAPAASADFLAAGCLIKKGDYIVAIINHNSRHMKHDGHEKIQLPIGLNRDEEHPDLSPQDVALQQTEEETGVTVKLLSDDPLRVEETPKGKVYTFACAPVEAEAFDNLVRAPVDQFIEVVRVNPVTMKDPAGNIIDKEWRYKADQKFSADYTPR